MNELYDSVSSAVQSKLSNHEERATVPAGTTLIQGVVPEHVIIIERGRSEVAILDGENSIVLTIPHNGRVLGLRPIVNRYARRI